MKVWRRKLHFWTPEEAKNASKAGNKDEEEAAFYEESKAEVAPSQFASRPLPEVVPVEVEPMQLGNGENSLLGQWTQNSQSSMAMDLQGDSCNPTAFSQKQDDDNLVFIPFQFE